MISSRFVNLVIGSLTSNVNASERGPPSTGTAIGGGRLYSREFALGQSNMWPSQAETPTPGTPPRAASQKDASS